MCFTVKTEKKTVQFSDDVQVETIEPEPEQAFIDEVSVSFVREAFILGIEVEMFFLSSLKKLITGLMRVFCSYRNSNNIDKAKITFESSSVVPCQYI